MESNIAGGLDVFGHATLRLMLRLQGKKNSKMESALWFLSCSFTICWEANVGDVYKRNRYVTECLLALIILSYLHKILSKTRQFYGYLLRFLVEIISHEKKWQVAIYVDDF